MGSQHLVRVTTRPLTLSARLVALGSVFALCIFLYTCTSTSGNRYSLSFHLPDTPSVFKDRPRASCSPEAWSNGSWTYRGSHTSIEKMTDYDQVLQFAGMEGCAADREYHWHLGADRPDMWDRFPAVTSYDWKPSDDCQVRPFNREAFAQELVEEGGWLLLGDSLTENHFFSLSCLLYPHVRATPNYTENPGYDRYWAQNLYLKPTSPIVPYLKFPKGFNIETTPLVTFRRVDIFFTQPELVELHDKIHPDLREEDFKLFGDESTWTLSPNFYMHLFTAPLPEANYGTLVMSTGGHWTTWLFYGYRDESKPVEGYGINGILEFFGDAMEEWAGIVQKTLDDDRKRQRQVKRQVVIRSYLPGHEDCHKHKEPLKETIPLTPASPWNWYWLQDFNSVFKNVLSSRKYPDIHFLSIDRPGDLRPDAHATSDCLHLMAGAGVTEGWTHYIWHYISRELPGRIR
ncbi:hypothetical protein JAAARDRAFT_158990 [Jaapia argillacea MUCL 33604]|uniref:Uncharacterized protein n=1 Tax=Jaapia argillacea MUCL 33604 TaxID=933084 RepID=A0A067PLH8_9AGAM|nr:hypothetical protein JAAARDRAFT_158990 [Jaapia argillacea MUCL 33604]